MYLLAQVVAAPRSIPPIKKAEAGNGPCYRCGSTAHWYQQCKASNKVAYIYKKYREFVEQESNYLEEDENSPDMIRSSQVIIGRGNAQFMFPNGTVIKVTEDLYAPRANRTLLSLKDIRANSYHLETHSENGIEYIHVTSNECGRKHILEKLMSQSSGLYLTIRIIESHVFTNDDLLNNDSYRLWHDRLGNPGHDMMIRVLKNSHGHPFFRGKKKMGQQTVIVQSNQLLTGKSVTPTRQLPSQEVDVQHISHSASLTMYFMVLVDASNRWSRVALLSTRNAAFAKLLTQIIRLRAHHPDYPIKYIILDNAGEFTSKGFDDYCMFNGIDVEHPVPHIHTQNGLTEANIKRLQMIARALVMRANLPITAWGYAILHASLLILFRPTASQPFSVY
ncbi:uncharacterized protein LOC113296134 [Papaver somniferum]|uniref:uncharacterized protein LOC113296134 n=1 Tax=Papaver somniferum TaxID=3469 RepID=UPI000E6FC453|nr:uncharacterized protein LOC113296134 [Papaver somniferum]